MNVRHSIDRRETGVKVIDHQFKIDENRMNETLRSPRFQAPQGNLTVDSLVEFLKNRKK